MFGDAVSGPELNHQAYIVWAKAWEEVTKALGLYGLLKLGPCLKMAGPGPVFTSPVYRRSTQVHKVFHTL